MIGTIRLTAATTAEDLSAVRELCWAYRDFLLNVSPFDAHVTETFYPVPKYTALMDKLAQEHARPTGIILLVRAGDTPIGCGMTHPLDTATAEIKRVFVNKMARGQGVAAKICKSLEEQARADGFDRLVLDTSKTLTAAQRLYKRLGFERRGPYQPIPADVLPHLLFYEKSL